MARDEGELIEGSSGEALALICIINDFTRTENLKKSFYTFLVSGLKNGRGQNCLFCKICFVQLQVFNYLLQFSKEKAIDLKPMFSRV